MCKNMSHIPTSCGHGILSSTERVRQSVAVDSYTSLSLKTMVYWHDPEKHHTAFKNETVVIARIV